MDNNAELDEKRERRRRALRAAQVVTLGLALSGCYQTHPATAGDAPVVAVEVGPLPDADVSTDGGTADAVADSGVCTCRTWDRGEVELPCAAFETGEAWGQRWGCAAWGPYVPPGDESLPTSRSALRAA